MIDTNAKKTAAAAAKKNDRHTLIRKAIISLFAVKRAMRQIYCDQFNFKMTARINIIVHLYDFDSLIDGIQMNCSKPYEITI